MSTHNIQFHNRVRKILAIFVFLSYRKNSVRTQKRVRISHGKRAIGVRAIEVQLYIQIPISLFFHLTLMYFGSPNRAEASIWQTGSAKETSLGIQLQFQG